jgi:hypothetical protein
MLSADANAIPFEELGLVATHGGEHALPALLHRAVNSLVIEASIRPNLYYVVRTLTRKRDYRCINRSTEIVIEGYPRSANSSTVHGLLDRQSRPVQVAHHTHHVAQLLRAIKWRIPAVALIRSPADAIQSNLALAAEGLARGGRYGRAAHLTFEDFAWGWLRFYTPLVRRRGALVIGRFEDVTRDVSVLIERVNAKFNTDFETKRVRETTLGYHAFPNLLRSELKSHISTHFRARLGASARLRRLVDDCERIYEMFRDAL